MKKEGVKSSIMLPRGNEIDENNHSSTRRQNYSITSSTSPSTGARQVWASHTESSATFSLTTTASTTFGNSSSNSNVHDSSFTSSISGSSDSFTHRNSYLTKNQRRKNSSTSTAPVRPSARKSNDLSDLTIDKLRFQALQGKLYGRDSEVSLLKSRLEELSTSATTARCCILIDGYSGTGKTALAKSLETQLRELKLNGLFVRGKFDNLTRAAGTRNNHNSSSHRKPYIAITDACSSICGALLQQQQQQQRLMDVFSAKLQEELGEYGLVLLLQMIPALAELLPAPPEGQVYIDDDKGKQSNKQQNTSNKDRIHFAFLKFLHLVTRHFFSPLVIVLDDLQWADVASLELLKVLLSSSAPNEDCQQPSKIMVVGTFRSNEVDDTHIFHRFKDGLLIKANNSNKRPFKMTLLTIGNLDQHAVTNVICDLLAGSTDDDEERRRSNQLAQICLKKTHGNVFFLLQFLSMLQQNQLLKFNFASMTWHWDEAAIESSTGASDNVVDLLTTKMMTHLSDEAVAVLRYAACLGSSFNKPMLRVVWNSNAAVSLLRDCHCTSSQHRSSLPTDETKPGTGEYVSLQAAEEALDTAIELLVLDGYFVRHEQSKSTDADNYSSTLSWSHDKIQEAAMELLPQTERSNFHRRLGVLLLDAEIDMNGASIFVVVNLLNGIVDTDEFAIIVQGESDEFRLQLARLNLQAAQRAIVYSAFENAAEYISCGIGWLPDNSWVGQYELSLALCTLGARCQGCLGNVEKMEEYCELVIEQNRPLEDKLDVYIARIDSLANRTKYDEAKRMCVDILKSHGCKFPNNSAMMLLKVISHLVRIKSTGDSRNVSDLQPMQDEARVKLMKILDQLGLYCYLSKDERMPLVFFKSLDWTFKYGHCAWSPTALATTGVILLGVTGDLKGGFKFGQLALQLQDKICTDTAIARNYLTTYCFLYVWVKPIREMMKPMLEAYDVGLRTGDTESGLWCIFHWIVLKMMAGSPLQALEADSRSYIAQMKELKRDMAAEFLTYMRQVYLNLMGKDNVLNPTNITGSALSEEALERHHKDPFHSAGIQAYQSILLTFFGKHQQRADWLISTGHDYLQKAMVASVKTMFDTCYAAVSCYAAARETGKRKYAKLGNILRGKIKKWSASGNPNVQHYEALLDAESLSLRKGQRHIDETIQKYQLAIWISTRGGYQHDAALATERLAEFKLLVVDDESDASFHFEKALRHWQEWGAAAKVEHIRSKYDHLLPSPSGMVVVPN